MNIVLIGFMGSGKSAVAKELGLQLKRPSIEMDDLVYQRTGCRNMHEVFLLGGEILLRESEIAIAKELASKDNLIVSTGGGVVLNKIILDYFKQTGGKVFFLHVSFETARERLAKDDRRPLFKEIETARELYDFRLPLYRHYADAAIEADSLPPLEIARKIALLLEMA